MALAKPKSTIPKNMDTIITTIITTEVEASVCLGVGHVTFFNSIFASFKNRITLSAIILTLFISAIP